MTTLIEAAQKLITRMALDRIEVSDWPDDSREAYLGLKQAIAQEQGMSPKSVSGTSERSCRNCRRTIGKYHWWCVSGQTIEGAICDHWEPKPNGYEDTLNVLKDERFSI